MLFIATKVQRTGKNIFLFYSFQYLNGKSSSVRKLTNSMGSMFLVVDETVKVDSISFLDFPYYEIDLSEYLPHSHLYQ